jgi:hypothetical protein
MHYRKRSTRKMKSRRKYGQKRKDKRLNTFRIARGGIRM